MACGGSKSCYATSQGAGSYVNGMVDDPVYLTDGVSLESSRARGGQCAPVLGLRIPAAFSCSWNCLMRASCEQHHGSRS